MKYMILLKIRMDIYGFPLVLDSLGLIKQPGQLKNTQSDWERSTPYEIPYYVNDIYLRPRGQFMDLRK